MKKAEYNWWTDPKNKEEIESMSWWNHKENQYDFPFPIALIQENENCWVASTNSKSEKLIGDRLGGCCQGKTKEEAIGRLFWIIKSNYNYQEECRFNYQRFVPFRKGEWKMSGGTWFVVFGFNVYFKYGKGMKGGFYIPFTKLNISFHSEWKQWNRWKKDKLASNLNPK